MKKKIYAVLLTLCLIIGLLPIQAFAEGETEAQKVTVSISGKTAVDNKLSADLSKLKDKDKAVVQWQKKGKSEDDSKAKDAGSGSSYTLKKDDVGKVFRIVVKETKDSSTSIKSGWTKEVTGADSKKSETKASEGKETETKQTDAKESETTETKATEAAESETTETKATEAKESETTETKATEAKESETAETKATETAESETKTTEVPETATQAEPKDTPQTDPASVTADPASLDFGEVLVGYAQPEKKQVKITNASGAEISAAQITYTTNDFTVQREHDGAAIANGASETFTVQPKENLAAGEYTFNITLTGLTVSPDSLTIPVKFKVSAATYSVKAAPEALDFGAAAAGYQTAPAAQTIEVTNDGNSAVVLTQPTAANFTLGALSQTTLNPGEKVSFTVQPKTGLAKGDYAESLEIKGDHDVKKVVSVKFTVTDAPTYTISVNKQTLNFTSSTLGYTTAPDAQTVEVTNTGNTAVKLIQPTAHSFNVGALSATELAPGAKASFTVQPLVGLESGSYEDTIVVKTEQNTEVQLKATFSVTGNKLVSIVKPSSVTAKNGRAKLASSLGLPTTVKIKTTDGEMKAKVSWNVGDTDYSKYILEKQKFTVKGTVTLPDGVTNPDGVSLETSISVTVKAYEPSVPSKSANKITGIEAGKYYNRDTNLTFKAIGGGMDNSSPQKGDVRYKPSAWSIDHQNSFGNDNYQGTFKILKAGTYTLKVTFDRQVYNGKKWESDETTDTKSVTFNISGTASTNKTTNNGKTAAKTGDTSPIIPLVIVCIVCILCIGGVVLSKRRKSKN